MRTAALFLRHCTAAVTLGIALALTACGGGSDLQAEPDGRARAASADVGTAESSQIGITQVTKVAERRISRTVFDYDFQVTFINRGEALSGATAALTTVGLGTTVVNGTVSIGDMEAAGVQIGMVTVRHDRTKPFDTASWRWTFSAKVVPDPVSAKLAYRPSGFTPRIGVPESFTPRFRLIDPRNAVTGFQVSNATAGGAQPTIDSAGKLTFTPNDADFATRELSVTVQLREGGAKTLSVPVTVLRETLVTTLALQSGQTRYGDARGGYVIDVGTFDGVQPSGSVYLVERRDIQGNVTYAAQVSNSNVWVKFAQAPVFGGGVAPAANTNRKQALRAKTLASDPEKPQEGLITLNGDEAQKLLRVNTVGSVLGKQSGAGGSNLYTTRVALTYPNRTVMWPQFWRSVIEYKLSKQVPAFQIDATCTKEGASSDDECGARTGAPVILIHGFMPEILGPFGGGTGTWGTMAKRLIGEAKDDRHVFEFRWVPQMRFEEAAGEFARMVQRVSEVTGKRPVIFAGSIGGLVARLALGGQGVTWDYADQKWVQVPSPTAVDRLITFGAPHSGLHDLTDGASVQVGRKADGTVIMRDFVYGRHNPDREISICEAITCIQAGAVDTYKDLALNAGLDKRGEHYDIFLHWVLGAEVGNEHYDLLEARAKNGGLGHLFAGETIARLDSVPVPTGMVAVVGVTPQNGRKLSDSEVGLIGDQLISYEGQMVSGRGLNLDQTLRAAIDGSEPSSTSNFRSSGGVEYFLLRNGRHTGLPQHQRGSLYPIAEANYSGAQSEYCPNFEYRLVPISIGQIIIFIRVCKGAQQTTESHHEMLIRRYLSGAGIPSNAASGSAPITGITGRFINRSMGTPLGGLPFQVSMFRKSDNRELGSVSGVSRVVDGGLSIDLGHLVPQPLWGAAFDASAYRVVLRWGDNTTWNVNSKEMASLASGSLLALGDVAVDPNSPFATASLSGAVIESQNQGNRVPGATIYLKRGTDLSEFELMATTTQSTTSRVVVADAAGAFSLTALEPGEYSALVMVDGFAPGLNGRISLLNGGNAQTFSVTRSSMRARWTFDDCSARDLSGNRNHGTLNGAVSCVAGLRGMAMRFAGGTISVPSSPSLKIDGALTLSALVWLDADNPTAAGILQKGITTVIWDYGMVTYAQLPGYRSTHTDWLSMPAVPNAGQAGGWHLFTTVVDEQDSTSLVRIYVDGRLLPLPIRNYTNEYSPSQFRLNLVNASDQSLTMGIGHPGLPLKGMIDEIRIHAQALTDAQVLQMARDMGLAQ